MKKTAFLFALALTGWLDTHPVAAQTNNWAVGFRLGEPAGVNVRKYVGTNHAFDLNVGTFGGLYGNVRDYRKGRYKNVGISFQGHYLWHGEVGRSERLRYHYGFGGQLNSRRYYLDRFSAAGAYDKTISIGGSGVAGLEYFLPDKPLSLFVETGLYAEVIPQPLFFNVQSGVGVRLNL